MTSKYLRSGGKDVLVNKQMTLTQTDTIFSHAPLDLANPNTIRLIEVLPPLVADSTIRCKLTHATTDAQYSCLSYVWGAEDADHTIFVNDLPFKVRKNLWEFLSKASGRFTSDQSAETGNINDDWSIRTAIQALWVDALCIDQKNTSERNHQVQQMGEIYRRSQRTVAWLGNDSLTNSFLGDVVTLSTFCKNAYWQRAWITQELLLATDISFIGGGNGIDLDDLKLDMGEVLAGFSRAYGYSKFQVLFDILERGEKCTLIENLWRFRQKHCLDRRDLVYSLLSISRNGLHFEVDYNVKLPDLALRVLQFLGEDFCLCSAKITVQTLGVLDDFSDAAERPFATVRLLSPISSCNFVCTQCNEVIRQDRIATELFPSLETRFYCLSCSHSDSRIQYLATQDALRHGHLILTRDPSDKEQSLCNPWNIYWLSPRDSFDKTGSYNGKPRGPLDGIQVLYTEEDAHRSAIIQISSKVFTEWASCTFIAEFRRTSTKDISLTGGYEIDDIKNLKWTLLTQDMI
jgi:hypothetical protein